MSFAIVQGAPMAFAKKCREGQAERLVVLANAGVTFDPVEARLRLGRRLVATDDVIDAAVMLLTAMRIESGAARRIPAIEQRDERGLRAEMWA